MSTFRAVNTRTDNERGLTHNGVIESQAHAADPAHDTSSPSPSEHSQSSNDGLAADASDMDGSTLNTPDTSDTDRLSDQSGQIPIGGASVRTIAPVQPRVVDPNCQAKTGCVAGSGDYRKTVSHIFGRNKAGTRRIPEECWYKWCRKHYQRFTYRCPKSGVWHSKQLDLVRKQLDRFEEQTNICSWDIVLRKKEQAKLDEENAAIAAGTITLTPRDPAIGFQPTVADAASPGFKPPQVWERFLVPYLGPSKTFAQVREVCDIIETEFSTPAFMAREEEQRIFPGLEFLPIFPDTKVKTAKNKNKTTTPTARGTKRKVVDTAGADVARGTKRKAVDTANADVNGGAKRARSGKAMTV